MNSSITKAEEILKTLENDYANSLNLCQRIRAGLKGGISNDRIKAYADFFFASQLLPLFHYEEEHLFPLLGGASPGEEVGFRASAPETSVGGKGGNSELPKEVAQELEDLVAFKKEEFFPELKSSKYAEPISELRSKEKEVLTPDAEDWDDKFWLKANFLTTSASF